MVQHRNCIAAVQLWDVSVLKEQGSLKKTHPIKLQEASKESAQESHGESNRERKGEEGAKKSIDDQRRRKKQGGFSEAEKDGAVRVESMGGKTESSLRWCRPSASLGGRISEARITAGEWRAKVQKIFWQLRQRMVNNQAGPRWF